VVLSVDCRPREFQGRSIDVGADELQENSSSYDKYLRRPRHMEDLTYVEMLRNRNTKATDEQRWQPFQGPKAKPRTHIPLIFCGKPSRHFSNSSEVLEIRADI